MASVILVKDGAQRTVQTNRAFVSYVYGDGWLPVIGTVAQAWEILIGASPGPQGDLTLEQRFKFGPTPPANPQIGTIYFPTPA